jgi:hypothetical protein
MGTTLTIGAVWKNKRTGEEYELLGHNIENDRVQIYPLKKNGDTAPIFMTANSLRKNYVAVAKRVTEENTVELKKVEKPVAVKKEKEVAVPKFKRVELLDGRVVSGIDFVTKIAGKTEEETCKNNSATWWLSETTKGKELLAQFNGKIVYKPLTK